METPVSPRGRVDGPDRFGRYVGFPPGSRFLLLPPRPARAARAGLALYEAVEPKQRLAARVGELLTRSGLAPLLPDSERSEVDREWWAEFISAVVEPRVGAVASVAFRVPGNPRVSALAMDTAGRPVAFAKLLNAASPQLPAMVSQLLDETSTTAFAVPRTLAEGTFAGWEYRLLEPLPEGLHHPPPYAPATVARIVDELHQRLSAIARPDGVAPRHVLCHADLTPRNLRVGADRRWWLFDWDNVRWGPRLSDELRYWCAWFAYRGRPRVERDARRIHGLLRRRGTAEEIREAVEWPDRVAQTYRGIEGPLLTAVGEIAR